jgi:ribosome-associated toxin RatA of RatAB toxin-antitoxin module
MTTLLNEITINAPIGKIWAALANIEELEKYDPAVKKSTALSALKSGPGATRKVDMRDDKNWFQEKVTIYRPNEAIEFELTACSFPVHQLKHTYSFHPTGNQIIVKQVMQYRIKYGLLGKIMDSFMIRKKSDNGIKLFLAGLKSYVEKNSGR